MHRLSPTMYSLRSQTDIGAAAEPQHQSMKLAQPLVWHRPRMSRSKGMPFPTSMGDARLHTQEQTQAASSLMPAFDWGDATTVICTSCGQRASHVKCRSAASIGAVLTRCRFATGRLLTFKFVLDARSISSFQADGKIVSSKHIGGTVQ